MGALEILCGLPEIESKPTKPFAEKVCHFLDAWSTELRANAEAKKYPDVMTFAFWIRKGNIQKKREQFLESYKNHYFLGRGMAFHIAPSNVPVNCMYSLVFGMLAGNTNIVRVPSKVYPQVDIMIDALKVLLEQEKWAEFKRRILIVRYNRDSQWTKEFSDKCMVRVIWGGDQTISEIRSLEIHPRCKEITFADRYSFGMISQAAIATLDDKALRTLSEQFYNDTYLMDQNACSSPQLILWKNDMPEDQHKEVKNKFWNAVATVAEKYDFADIKSSEKFGMICEAACQISEVKSVQKYIDNRLYVCELEQLPANAIEVLRGKFGFFYQMNINSLSEIDILSDCKVQTCAYYGIDSHTLLEQIMDLEFQGIDRIVPFGKTLDIDLIWDGYDLVREMSREITVD